MKIFDGNYLFNTPQQMPSPFFSALTAGFAVMFLVGAFVYWRRAKLAPKNPVLRKFLRRIASTAMWLAAFGLIIAGCRYAELDYVGMPMWMYLLFLYIIGAVAYYVYDYVVHYPVAVHRLHVSASERRYRPLVRPKADPQRVRPKARGKRRR